MILARQTKKDFRIFIDAAPLKGSHPCAVTCAFCRNFRIFIDAAPLKVCEELHGIGNCAIFLHLYRCGSIEGTSSSRDKAYPQAYFRIFIDAAPLKVHLVVLFCGITVFGGMEVF